MTIYYSLTFLLLAAEMATFTLLVIPFPHPVRKRVFGFFSESPIIAKIAYGVKISFIFVGILFFDALQRMFRITAEADMAKSGQQGMGDVRTETSFAARKFYAQRNVYLTGFTLFLSLVLTRTFAISLELIHNQEEYIKLKKTGSSGDKDYDALENKYNTQLAEYNRLADKYNKLSGNKADKKKD
ncbi:hypothetical protein D9757_007382 [Collybiopsis confluens]|uniref:Endoplasmic reticulum transmembrane protein n=1 Tax=Collybiopsis confluens TaxID=2823264 RepID=A0A8H5HIC0_9AGAR|nr:hypothetical protein D9757_007382 [Collybiopsis confluens]